MRLLRSSLLVLVTFLSAACDSSPPRKYVGTRDSLVAAAKPSKAVGESCEDHGASECLSSLCLAVATARSSQGHICTQVCQRDTDCPDQFNCGEIAPRTLACIPARTWVERAATPRSVPVLSSLGTMDAGLGATLSDGGN